eukprot:386924_1
MKSLLLLSLLVVPSLSVTIDCSSSNYQSPSFVDGGTDCVCVCDPTTGDDVCAVFDDIKSEIAKGSGNAYLAFIEACQSKTPNALATPLRCNVGDTNYLEFPDGDCAAACPVCNQAAYCVSDVYDKPFCKNGVCKVTTCTTTTDESGNTMAATTTDDSTDCTETCGTTTSDCSSSNYAKPAFVNDGTDCVCSCLRGTDTCVAWSDLQSDIKSISTNGGLSHGLYALMEACATTNTDLATCGDYIDWNEDEATCSCPICDTSALCTAINAEEAFCRQGTCKKRVCVTTTDDNGNTYPTTTLDISDECSETCSTNTGCTYSTIPTLLDDDSDNCVCKCGSDGADTCITKAEIITAIDAGKDLTDANLLALKYGCKRDTDVGNPGLSGCMGSITFPATDRTAACSALCPYCDESSVCDNTDQYECKYGVCKEVTCTTAEDQYGNIRATISFSEVDDETLCDANGCDENECDVEGGIVVDESTFCWSKCKVVENIRRLVAYAEISTLREFYDGLVRLKSVCKARNTELVTAYAKDIVPEPFSDDKPWCGCGVVRETCDFDTYYRKTRVTDDAGVVTTVCKQFTCTLTKKEVTDTADSTRTYSNTRREQVETTVEITKCDTHTHTDSTPSPVSSGDTDCTGDICVGAGVDDIVCVTTGEGKTFTTCLKKLACLRLAGDTNFKSVPGRCRSVEVTEDECDASAGDYCRISEERNSLSECPLLCGCQESKDGVAYEVCRTPILSDAGFDLVKAACPDQLGDDACVSYKMLQWRECPDFADDDFCEKLSCSTEVDPTDLDGGAICTESIENFEATDTCPREDRTACVETLDESAGCKYCECADDGSNELICTRFDDNTIDSKGILRRCPELKECSNVETYDLRGLCGACPTCEVADGVDDDCDGVIRNGDDACTEDPQSDDTRPTDDAIVGRVRLAIGAKACAENFLSYSREKLYALIKKAALMVVGDECSIELLTLRAYIVAFEYDVSIDTDTDATCNAMVKAKAVVHFSDVDLSVLTALKECLEEIAKLDQFPAKIRVALKTVTANTRLEAAEDGSTTTNDEGDEFYENATVDPDVELLSDDGLTVIEDDVETTTGAPEDTSTGTTKEAHVTESAAAGLSMIGAIVASYIAWLF